MRKRWKTNSDGRSSRPLQKRLLRRYSLVYSGFREVGGVGGGDREGKGRGMRCRESKARRVRGEQRGMGERGRVEDLGSKID